MKRTCDGCRARDLDSCDLKYKTKIVPIRNSVTGTICFIHVPTEDCPKPRTYEKLMMLIREKESMPTVQRGMEAKRHADLIIRVGQLIRGDWSGYNFDGRDILELLSQIVGNRLDEAEKRITELEKLY